MKRVQAKGFFLTYPKCTATKEQLLESLPPLEEYVICQEVHKDGDPHLHAFIKYSSKVTWKEDKWDFQGFHGNYQVAKSWNAVKKYVEKDGNYISNLNIQNARQKKAKKNEELLSKTAKQAVDDGDINLIDLPRLIKAKDLYALQEPGYEGPRKCLWIWGETGVGKSRRAHEDYPEAYKKPQSKWWDGYQGQKCVILDDLDTPTLGHYLKIWADRYRCTGETKGGTIPLMHDTFVVTSNLSIDQLFSSQDNQHFVEPLRRRFQMINMIQLQKQK